MGKLAIYLGGVLMVFPTRYDQNYLSSKEEEDLFSYIFAGILFDRGISSRELNSQKLGIVEAKVLGSYEIAAIWPPSERGGRLEKDGWITVRLRSGTQLEVGPTPARALHIMFRSQLGKVFVYAEISFKQTGYTLDNVLNVPHRWLSELKDFSWFNRIRILKMPELGRRALLVESKSDYVVELPGISDRGTIYAGDDSLKRYPKPVRLADYLEQILRPGR